MSKSVIINDINNASPNVTTHIIPAIRAINKGSNYDDLGNKPIYNINLLEEGFEPIEGDYYRHTGETNDTFTTGVIYYYKEGKYTPITGSVKSAPNFACTGILEKSKWVDKSITYTEPKSLKYYDVSSYTEKVKCAGIKNNILYQFNSNGYYKTDLENPDAHEFISWASTEVGEELTGNVDPIMCTTNIFGDYGEALFILCSQYNSSNTVIVLFDIPQYDYVDYIGVFEMGGNISSIIALPTTNEDEQPNIWGIKDNTKLIQFGGTDEPDKFSIDLPERISDSNLCIYNNELYITGGSIKNIYKFNFDTKEITKVCTVSDYFGPSFQIDAPCYAIVINNKIYGIDGDNNLVVYDMNGAKIGEVPKILDNEDYTYPAFYCALIYHNNNLYISHCLAQGYNNPVGFVIAELKDIRYEYSIENEGIKENSATSISLNSNYPIIDATKTQGKISLISSNTPDDNKYSIIQVPTQDTNVLEVSNTYRIQKISEVENDRGFVTGKQVKSEIRLFNQTYQPDWEEENPNSVTYIKNKDNVNYTLTESDWTKDCFSIANISVIANDGEVLTPDYLGKDSYGNYNPIQGKIKLNNVTKDVIVSTRSYKDGLPVTLDNNSIFYSDGGVEYKQLIINGIPTDGYINSLQYFENTPANNGFLWLLRLTKGDDVYESTDGINYTVSTRFKNRYRILNTNGVWVSNLSSEKYNSSTREYYQTIDYSSNNGNTWSTSTIVLEDKQGFGISDLQVCKDGDATYFMGQNKNNTVVKISSNGKNWYHMDKSYDDYKFNMIRSVGDGIFIFDVNGNLKRLHKSDNFRFVEYNNFGRPNNSRQIDYLKYFEGRYIYSDYTSGDYYIYSFENGFTDNPTFDTTTKYISHGGGMPPIMYYINGRFVSEIDWKTGRTDLVAYTNVLQNTADSRIVFDAYFTHNYLQNNRDSKIRLYKYKSAHNISRDEETGNFYSKYGERPTIYITAIPAAARFDLLVNEYAEV